MLQQRLAVALFQAVLAWAYDRSPNDPGDAELLKAVWSYGGDNLEPCEGCDGECEEPCAPSTVAEAHAALDRFTEDYNRRHGIQRVEAVSRSKKVSVVTENLGQPDEEKPL
jgi:hypothetical protein